MHKICTKYARYMQKICSICQKICKKICRGPDQYAAVQQHIQYAKYAHMQKLRKKYAKYVFGIIRRDPETLLVLPTNTRIPAGSSRAGHGPKGHASSVCWGRVRAQSRMTSQSVHSHRCSPFSRILFKGEQTNKHSSSELWSLAALHTDPTWISPIFG